MTWDRVSPVNIGTAPSFRPTVVVLVGVSGQEAGEQLYQLLRSTAPELRDGIALLLAPTGWRDEAAPDTPTLGTWFQPGMAKCDQWDDSVKGILILGSEPIAQHKDVGGIFCCAGGWQSSSRNDRQLRRRWLIGPFLGDLNGRAKRCRGTSHHER